MAWAAATDAKVVFAHIQEESIVDFYLRCAQLSGCHLFVDLFNSQTPMFRYEAMLTHKMYGIRSVPAHPETRKEVIIVARIRSHKTIIVMTPPPFDFIPKKIIDHRALSTSWIQNSVKASNAPLVANPFCQTRKTEIPIRIYRVVQTGPNAQLGGV